MKGELPLCFEPLRTQAVKNIAGPVRVYRMLTGPPTSERVAPLEPATPGRADRPSIAALPFANMTSPT